MVMKQNSPPPVVETTNDDDDLPSVECSFNTFNINIATTTNTR